MGSNTCMSWGSVFVLGRYPITPASEVKAKYWMNRAKQWASGKNSSRRELPSSTSGTQSAAARVMLTKFLCESSAPFGVPVEPEV